MNDYYLQHADSLAHFKAEARKAFASICLKYDFREEDDGSIDDSKNLFQSTFSNQFIRVIVEGVNWGMNVRVCLEIKGDTTKRYSIHRLLQVRPPAGPISGSQNDQLYAYALYLETYADDVLRGSKSFFIQQDALSKDEKERAQQAREIEEKQKLSAGYLKIVTTLNEVIWRKPRPLLLTHVAALQQFPRATNVQMYDALPYDQYHDAFITHWKKELNEHVEKDEILCEITTEKVSVEITAPVSGTLVWLLEEGHAVKPSHCIALINT